MHGTENHRKHGNQSRLKIMETTEMEMGIAAAFAVCWVLLRPLLLLFAPLLLPLHVFL